MSSIKIEVLAGEVEAKLKEMQAAGADMRPAWRAVGAYVLSRIQLGFRVSRSPWGVPWTPLSSRTGQPLKNTGVNLLKSITSREDADGATIGTNKFWAPVHQFGATIIPKNAQRLVFQINGVPVFAKSVTIPARPFMPITPAGKVDLPVSWQKGILERLAKHLGVGEVVTA